MRFRLRFGFRGLDHIGFIYTVFLANVHESGERVREGVSIVRSFMERRLKSLENIEGLSQRVRLLRTLIVSFIYLCET